MAVQEEKQLLLQKSATPSTLQVLPQRSESFNPSNVALKAALVVQRQIPSAISFFPCFSGAKYAQPLLPLS